MKDSGDVHSTALSCSPKRYELAECYGIYFLVLHLGAFPARCLSILLTDNSLIFTLLLVFPEGQNARLHLAVQSFCLFLGKP